MSGDREVCHVAHPDLDLARTLAANARGFLCFPPSMQDGHALQDRFHLLAVALELALKSYLIARGHTDETTRRIGHHLRAAADVAEAEGLVLDAPLQDLIDDTHPFFMHGGFHRERRTGWSKERADRASAALTVLLDHIDAPIGAR